MHREPVQYTEIPAHGVKSPEYSKDQIVRSHEAAKESRGEKPGSNRLRRRRDGQRQAQVRRDSSAPEGTVKVFDALRPT
jgi:hypothetical protein